MNTFSNAKVKGSILVVVIVVVVVVSKPAARFRVLGLSQVIAPQANSDLRPRGNLHPVSQRV